MKKKFLAVFSIVFVMAFAVAVYAFNQSNISNKTTASNCAMSDNCPLKNKNAQTAANHAESCCDNPDCCCKNGSCPMKANKEKSADCCDDCCGGSCPMQKKAAQASMTEASGATITDVENFQRSESGI